MKKLLLLTTLVLAAVVSHAQQGAVTFANGPVGTEVRRASDGAHVEMVRTVWSFTYCCPSCSVELVYLENMRNERTAGPDACPHCAAPFVKRKWPRGNDLPSEVVVRGPSIEDWTFRSDPWTLMTAGTPISRASATAAAPSG